MTCISDYVWRESKDYYTQVKHQGGLVLSIKYHQNLLKRLGSWSHFYSFEECQFFSLLYFHYFKRQFHFSNWRLIIRWSDVLRQRRMVSYWISKQTKCSVIKRLWTLRNFKQHHFFFFWWCFGVILRKVGVWNSACINIFIYSIFNCLKEKCLNVWKG